MSDITDKVEWYVDRLILQYRTKPKARGMVAILAKQLMADDLASTLAFSFSLDTAIGVQLDVLGKYIGVNRNIGPSTPPPLFSLWTYASILVPANYQGTWDPTTDTPAVPAADPGNTGWWYVASASGLSATPIAYDWVLGDILYSNGAFWSRLTTDSGNGLTTYANPAINADAIFWSYARASRAFSALSDDSYRTVLKLQALLNGSDGTLSSIVALLYTFFPGLITVTDNTDMTLTYLVVSTVPLSVDLLRTFLPHPMGVGINIIIINPLPDSGDVLVTEPGGDTLVTEDGIHLVTEG